MQNIVLDLEFAREIELAEAEAAVGCAKMMQTLQPDSAGTFEAIGGGFAVYCGPDNPVTQAVGLGLNGPVSSEEFDHLESFYFSRNEPVRVETCPLAHATLIGYYKARGYHVSEFSNVMVREVRDDRNSSPSFPSDVEIRAVSRNEIDLWVLTVAKGFSENYPVTQELLSMMKMFALAENTECYMASIDGHVAGGATFAVRGRIGGLFGASTLPEFRNRGVQTALLLSRLKRAREVGCEFVMSLAQPGSASQRNITRFGLQTLYTRVKFERSCPR